jgi:hypothetical protein
MFHVPVFLQWRQTEQSANERVEITNGTNFRGLVIADRDLEERLRAEDYFN